MFTQNMMIFYSFISTVLAGTLTFNDDFWVTWETSVSTIIKIRKLQLGNP